MSEVSWPGGNSLQVVGEVVSSTSPATTVVAATDGFAILRGDKALVKNSLTGGAAEAVHDALVE